jgi:1-acyl-sn-glycerol-3-phosphate acyltransferase
MPLEPLIEKTAWTARLARTLKAIPLTGLGFASLLVVNVAQTASLLVLPFSRTAFRRFNRWCANTWWGACVVASQRINRTRLIVTGEDLPADENALVLANHQDMPDILALMILARGKSRLGDLKFFVKHALKWVPGVGWGMQFISCPFLRRDWTADRERIRRTFDSLVRERIPVWLVSFAEGTRATPDKIRISAEWALAQGIEATRHVQIPRTKGFAATIEGLGDHLHAVYDVTIGYVDGVPTLWQYITGSVQRIHVHVRRFPIETLPRLEHELRDWLLARYREKDALLEHYYATGSFPSRAIGPGV